MKLWLLAESRFAALYDRGSDKIIIWSGRLLWSFGKHIDFRWCCYFSIALTAKSVTTGGSFVLVARYVIYPQTNTDSLRPSLIL